MLHANCQARELELPMQLGQPDFSDAGCSRRSLSFEPGNCPRRAPTQTAIAACIKLAFPLRLTHPPSLTSPTLLRRRRSAGAAVASPASAVLLPRETTVAAAATSPTSLPPCRSCSGVAVHCCDASGAAAASSLVRRRLCSRRRCCPVISDAAASTPLRSNSPQLSRIPDNLLPKAVNTQQFLNLPTWKFSSRKANNKQNSSNPSNHCNIAMITWIR